MTYRDEFSDYPADKMPGLPEGFIDQSWHNDVCPHFVNLTLGVGVWIDYPRPTHREFPGAPRFTIEKVDADGASIENGMLLQTDDWEAIIHKIWSVEADLDRAVRGHEESEHAKEC